jgi:hypothetical protein
MSLYPIPCTHVDNRFVPEAPDSTTPCRQPIAADTAYNTLLPIDKGQVREIAAGLDLLLHGIRPEFSNMMHIVMVGVLRKLDSWGITMNGESLGRYFDLGSIDNGDPGYPITTDELRALRRALARLENAGEGSLRPRAASVAKVISGGC